MYFIWTKIVFSKSLKYKQTFLFNAILNEVKNSVSVNDYRHLRILMVLLLIVFLKLDRKHY